MELMQRYSKLADVSKICSSTAVRAVPVVRPRIHNVRKRLGPEAIAQLVADYQAGASTRALMAKYKIGKGTVLRILDDHGIERRYQLLTEEQVQQTVQLYQQGWSLLAVGEHLGRSDSVVRRALQRAGVGLRERHGPE